MNEARINRLLFWSPRIITLAFSLFLVIFGFDAFGGPDPIWKQILGFLMHLIPTYLIWILLVLAWKWEWVGAVFFAVLGIVYIYWAWGRFPLSVYLEIAGPLFVVSGLFLWNWLEKRKLTS